MTNERPFEPSNTADRLKRWPDWQAAKPDSRHFPESPSTHKFQTLRPQSTHIESTSYRKHIKTKVDHVGVHGPFGKCYQLLLLLFTEPRPIDCGGNANVEPIFLVPLSKLPVRGLYRGMYRDYVGSLLKS